MATSGSWDCLGGRHMANLARVLRAEQWHQWGRSSIHPPHQHPDSFKCLDADSSAPAYLTSFEDKERPAWFEFLAEFQNVGMVFSGQVGYKRRHRLWRLALSFRKENTHDGNHEKQNWRLDLSQVERGDCWNHDSLSHAVHRWLTLPKLLVNGNYLSTNLRFLVPSGTRLCDFRSPLTDIPCVSPGLHTAAGRRQPGTSSDALWLATFSSLFNHNILQTSSFYHWVSSGM